MQRGCFQDFFGSKHVANIFGSKHFIIFGIRLPNDTLLTVQCRTSGSSDTSLSPPFLFFHNSPRTPFYTTTTLKTFLSSTICTQVCIIIKREKKFWSFETVIAKNLDLTVSCRGGSRIFQRGVTFVRGRVTNSLSVHQNMWAGSLRLIFFLCVSSKWGVTTRSTPLDPPLRWIFSCERPNFLKSKPQHKHDSQTASPLEIPQIITWFTACTTHRIWNNFQNLLVFLTHLWERSEPKAICCSFIRATIQVVTNC